MTTRTLERPYHLAVVNHGNIYLYDQTYKLISEYHLSHLDIKTKLLHNGSIAWCDQTETLGIWNVDHPNIQNSVQTNVHVSIHIMFELPNEEICIAYVSHWHSYFYFFVIDAWNMKTKTNRQLLKVNWNFGSDKYAHMSNWYFVVTNRHEINIHDLKANAYWTIPISSCVCILLPLQRNRFVVRLASDSQRAYVFQIVNDNVVCRSLYHKSRINQIGELLFDRLVMSHDDYTISVWDIATETCVLFCDIFFHIRTFHGGPHQTFCVFSGEPQYDDQIASRLKLWNFANETGCELNRFQPIAHRGGVINCKWLRDNELAIITGVHDSTLQRFLDSFMITCYRTTGEMTELKGSAIYVVYTKDDNTRHCQQIRLFLVTYLIVDLCDVVAMYI